MLITDGFNVSYIVTNIAYGTGPYLRITELCIAFNEALIQRGEKPLPFIVPLIYGEKQRKVMLEEFAEYDAKNPRQILLDRRLGELLGSIFYKDSTYEEALEKWVVSADLVTMKIREYLSGLLTVETLSGEVMSVHGADIVLEINRSPRIFYGVAPAYSTSFGYITDILQMAIMEGRDRIDVDPLLLQKGVELASRIESAQTLTTMAYPGTFSWHEDYVDRFGARLVPPIRNLPTYHARSAEEGVFVTITGIPGLERLYQEAKELGLRLYSNDTEAVPGSIRALPHIIPNSSIKLQFARSGWGSVWLSMFCGVPLVVPEFDSKDDPEIYFNNKAVEAMGIGVVYRGQSLAEILTQGVRLQSQMKSLYATIERRFGSLDGNRASAQLFADHFLCNQKS